MGVLLPILALSSRVFARWDEFTKGKFLFFLVGRRLVALLKRTDRAGLSEKWSLHRGLREVKELTTWIFGISALQAKRREEQRPSVGLWWSPGGRPAEAGGVARREGCGRGTAGGRWPSALYHWKGLTLREMGSVTEFGQRGDLWL